MSFSLYSQANEKLEWYKNNFEKLTNQLDLGQFYSTLIAENSVQVKLDSTLVETVFKSHTGFRLIPDKQGLVQYLDFENDHFPIRFFLKRSTIYPLYFMQVVNDNRHFIEGVFLFDGNQFFYFNEYHARGGRSAADRYKLLSEILLLDHEFRTINLLKFAFETDPHGEYKGGSSYFVYRLFSAENLYTYCLRYQNSTEGYSPETMATFFDLLKQNYLNENCENRFELDLTIKDTTKRFWYDYGGGYEIVSSLNKSHIQNSK
jgi:hypothetical protein